MRGWLTRILGLDHGTAVAADLVALTAFVTVGLLNHHGGLSLAGYAHDLLPIAGCWLLAAATVDLYRRPRLPALLVTWAAGVTAGIALRQLVLWELEGDDAVFLGVALCFTLLFVLVVRTAASFLRA